MFDGFLSESIIKRAIEQNLVVVNIINFRDYSKDPHKKVDDTPYGGGSGMLLTVQPIYDAVMELRKEDTLVVLLTPDGIKYKQEMAVKLSKEKHIVLICGHYEGFDERIRTIVDMEISIGDYILTGGELPGMVISDSIIRLIDGVIEKDSLISESFNNNLLDYPTYTKPREFIGMKVPEVLLNGNHKEIEEYRKKESIRKTQEKRPDLLER